MAQADVFRMVGRRAEAAGVRTSIGCHSFRATGITEYLRNGGKLEIAQQMANHESARTTGCTTGDTGSLKGALRGSNVGVRRLSWPQSVRERQRIKPEGSSDEVERIAHLGCGDPSLKSQRDLSEHRCHQNHTAS
jgi:hypothetical protein